MKTERLIELKNKGYITESEFLYLKLLQSNNDMLAADFRITLDKLREEVANVKGLFPNKYYLKLIDKYRGEQSKESASATHH